MTPVGTLLVCAAPSEAAAVLRAFDRAPTDVAPPIAWKVVPLDDRTDLVVTGVGKANAAAGVARAFDPLKHARVINIGIAGALPRSRLNLLDAVAASLSMYADEGVQTPERFIDIAACGFAPNQGLGRPSIGVAGDPALIRTAEALGARAGPVATVSTCSARNRLAVLVTERTGAIAEAMEGAAAAFTVLRLAAPPAAFLELRVISNTTGNRAKQRWDLAGALARTGELARAISK